MPVLRSPRRVAQHHRWPNTLINDFAEALGGICPRCGILGAPVTNVNLPQLAPPARTPYDEALLVGVTPDSID